MRKLTILTLLLLLVVPFSQASAAVNSNYFYVPDYYIVQFDPAGVVQVNMDFNGGQFHKEFTAPGGFIGVAYLRCNGSYNLTYLYADHTEMVQYVTTEIVNPTCESTTMNSWRDDLNASYDDDQIKWNDDGGSYDIYKDGTKVGQTPAGTTEYKPSGDGVYTIKSSTGSSSDVKVSGSGGGSDTPSSGNCDACKQLKDALDCPYWDDYMGDLTQAIKNALPPPPDWDQVADTFVDHFADYFGDVPPVPSKPEIDRNITPPLPDIDTDVPDADQQLTVPNDFDKPTTFDVTDAPEIPVVDESEPIEIYEPDAFIGQHDDPGKPVYPGDPHNSSGGIKEPDHPDTGGAALPQASSSGSTPALPQPGGSTVPPADMPTPGGSADPPPLPSVPESNMPIPSGGSGSP